MKTRYFKAMLLTAAMVAAGLSLGAQSVKQEDSREYSASSSTELSIENQFGNITVTDWDQNKLVIIYIIEVTNSDEAKAKKLMEKIKIDIKEEGNRITAKTNIGEEGSLKLHNDKGEKQSFRIDYFVKCPKSIKISLDNQFGDMIVGSLTGSFSADLQFGSLNAVSLAGPETKIDMQFGDLTIGIMKDGKIDIQHCDALKITECGNLTVDGQFSKIDIGNAVSVKADLNNCEMVVNELSEKLKLDSNMGNTKVENVSAGFKSIEIEQNLGDINLGIDPKAGYKLTAEVNMSSVKVPAELKLTKEKDEHVPGGIVDKVSGTFGNGNSIVTINCNMGSVKIK